MYQGRVSCRPAGSIDDVLAQIEESFDEQVTSVEEPRALDLLPVVAESEIDDDTIVLNYDDSSAEDDVITVGVRLLRVGACPSGLTGRLQLSLGLGFSGWWRRCRFLMRSACYRLCLV